MCQSQWFPEQIVGYCMLDYLSVKSYHYHESVLGVSERRGKTFYLNENYFLHFFDFLGYYYCYIEKK